MISIRFHRRAAGLILAAGLLLASCAAAAAPSVVVTIRPLHSLTAMVMQGVGKPKLLIRTLASPHSYALRPSDALMLNRADMVIWTGESMETFLARALPGLPDRVTVVTAMDFPDMELLPPRAPSGETPADEEGDEHDRLPDPHLWLSTENAARLLADIAGALGKIDPEHAQTYAENAQRAALSIRALKGELAEELAPDAGRTYIAAHDAYHYFERDYGLVFGGAVTAHPGRPPSAKHILALTRRIKDEHVSCLMTEPDYRPPIADQLAKANHLKLMEGDPLGLDETPGLDLYPRLMRRLAASFRTCLGD